MYSFFFFESYFYGIPIFPRTYPCIPRDSHWFIMNLKFFTGSISPHQKFVIHINIETGIITAKVIKYIAVEKNTLMAAIHLEVEPKIKTARSL